MSDLEGLDATGLGTGFFNPNWPNGGFRCKTLTVCGTQQACIYFSQRSGSLQSGEASYYDGDTVHNPPRPVKLYLGMGAASQCGELNFGITAGQSFVMTYDGGRVLRVYVPAITTTQATLWVGSDGSTYFDANLTQLAQASPP
jgi:hypothetical protein